MNLPRFLTDPDLRLLLFGGKGGVGKTTCAVAAGLSIAGRFPGRRVQLLSTDPAHSLSDSVAGMRLPETVTLQELDARESLEDFRRRHGRHLQQIAERGTFLDREDIDRFLALSLPGMDELFGFLDLAQRARAAGEQEHLVVDTAPSGHTLRLLAMPELLRDWVGVLDTLLAKHRYMKQLFAGTYRPDELDRFLEGFWESTAAARELLSDSRRCRFVPVMLAEELSLRETAALLDALDRLAVPSEEVVVNRLAPSCPCASCTGLREQQWGVLRRLPAEFAPRRLWGTPMRPHEVRGAELHAFWGQVRPLDPRAPPSVSGAASGEPAPRVEDPAPLPAPELQLLLFAGKGGVGKTTLACATALRIARGLPEHRTLLFSTDPAHSLGDCLDLPIGPKATAVRPGLTALEMDAQSELDALKRQYRSELDAFLASVLGGFDVPFDREVMQRIIELTPPGLDEIMAVTQAIERLGSGAYDLLILDAAPTGHLVRLLETPQLVDDWLKAFFELFLKYREVFGVPRVAERLVRVSKGLRRFRALLGEPARSALYAVSEPTRMALEETRDLFAACSRLGVSVPLVFLNMMTADACCPFCAQRAAEERETERAFAKSLPSRRVRLFRGAEPRGQARLGRLGDALYEAGAEARPGRSPDAHPSP